MATKFYDPKTFSARGSIGYLLKMAHQQLHDCASAVLVPHELSFMQWITLMKLREGAALTASDLCREMRHDNGAFTRLLDQLEQRDFVVRTRSRTDRRVIELKLTPAGQRKLDVVIPQVVERLNGALGVFTKTEFNELLRLLIKLREGLEAAEARADAAESSS